MTVLAFNGSPRKAWNTATLLKHALEGAAARGAKTELIHLYDLDFKGCISCFACKLKGGPSYGRCAVQDDLTPVLRKVREADALIFGSPIYIGAVTGEMRSFLERLVFPYLVYDANYSSLFPGKLPTGFIYTLGADERRMKEAGYDQSAKMTEMLLARIFGTAESLLVTDTYQFDDYAKYVATAFDVDHKARVRSEEFPKSCQKAYEMGRRLASG
ncbi:MAG TPA: flavodoxin family protein [Selenomonadales bacterium]|nr:flavodoxin family protein [Selenomonadales bacterium]